jgi:crossover junction endodeoxyribonuclease RusA
MSIFPSVDHYLVQTDLFAYLEIEVVGTPVPQGNLVAGRFGGVHERDPRVRLWRDNLVIELVAANSDRPPLWSPVEVEVRFFLPWLKKHYSQSKAKIGELKADAPRMPTAKPDLDKLQRAVGDALTESKVINDDSLIVSWVTSKWYATRAGASIKVRTVDTSSFSYGSNKRA